MTKELNQKTKPDRESRGEPELHKDDVSRKRGRNQLSYREVQNLRKEGGSGHS